MKRTSVSELDELMMDIIAVHRSLWNPMNDERMNLFGIQSLRESKIPSVKWFMSLFVHDDPKVSTSNLVAISHGLVGMWAFGSSSLLSENEMLDLIDGIWERKQNHFPLFR